MNQKGHSVANYDDTERGGERAITEPAEVGTVSVQQITDLRLNDYARTAGVDV